MACPVLSAIPWQEKYKYIWYVYNINTTSLYYSSSSFYRGSFAILLDHTVVAVPRSSYWCCSPPPPPRGGWWKDFLVSESRGRISHGSLVGKSVSIAQVNKWTSELVAAVAVTAFPPCPWPGFHELHIQNKTQCSYYWWNDVNPKDELLSLWVSIVKTTERCVGRWA